MTPLPRGATRIGCLNNPAKLERDALALALIVAVLHEVPHATLVLQAFVFHDASQVRRLRRLLSVLGVDEKRVECHASAGLDSHLRLHGSCHIAIDSVPWTSHTTTCHALWMGVPVVTIAGDRQTIRTRMRASDLTNEKAFGEDFLAAVNDRR